MNEGVGVDISVKEFIVSDGNYGVSVSRVADGDTWIVGYSVDRHVTVEGQERATEVAREYLVRWGQVLNAEDAARQARDDFATWCGNVPRSVKQ